ncbi:MAG: hypothetical protein LAN71_17180 [Acidobacteriia bacterium]|nr:hypothetical protein [Terriglobia bacterium]
MKNMVSAIKVNEDKLDIMDRAIDIVYKNAGINLKQTEFLDFLLDTDPEEVAKMILIHMKKRMNKVTYG